MAVAVSFRYSAQNHKRIVGGAMPGKLSTIIRAERNHPRCHEMNWDQHSPGHPAERILNSLQGAKPDDEVKVSLVWVGWTACFVGDAQLQQGP
jgi:hypothetical protein